jgi:alpha-amylase
MADRTQLVLVIHNHQPVGNFDAVIDDACTHAYLPFLEMLAEFPQIRLGLHTSGCLWEWLEAHRPEYGELVAELLQRGQLELLGGGMYEPILPVLPERDTLWQLKRMSEFLRQRFGVTPRGMWCPERVWEPHMPGLIAKAGLAYTLLDDHHFGSSALPEQVSREYFTTEHAGSQCALYPISKKLRYTLPFKPVEHTINYLRELMGGAKVTPLVVFGDDGEKFGVWPETYEWVYEKGWLRDFFTALMDNLDWIELLLPGEVLERRRSAGKVFVPCMSYTEMGEWSRVDPNAGDDDPPGFWRNYLHKYPEANAMYRRMLGVSELLQCAREDGIPASALEDAAADLGRAQCNCAYWHGIFGGLYLNYLRHAVYYHLLKAEQALRAAAPQLIQDGCEVIDHDGLGWEQVVLRSSDVTALADPGRGLCMSRLDYHPTYFCWTNVLSRQLEHYHAKVLAADVAPDDTGEHESIHDRVQLKEEGLARRLVVDPHQRVSFTTYFSDITSPEQLMHVAVDGELAPAVLGADYEQAALDMQTKDNSVSGVVSMGSLQLQKSLRLDGTCIQMGVNLAGGAHDAALPEFFVEFNLTLLTDQAADRYLLVAGKQHAVAEPGVWPGAQQLALVDGWQGLELTLESAALKRILYYPVYTVSSSEGGFERTYQGSCIMLGYAPQALLEGIHIELRIEEAAARESG